MNLLVKKRFVVAAIALLLGCFGWIAQAQQVSVTLKNATLQELFSAIESQTAYRFAYRNVVLNKSKSVNIAKTNVDVSALLTEALASTNLTFTIVSDKSIAIAERREAPKGAPKKISGTVVDDKGEAVIGANVSVKGTTNGTITDIDGRFDLDAAQGSTLLISYIGYTPKEIAVGAQSSYAISIAEDMQKLDEVVVVGYGTMKKGNLAMAVSTVKSEAIKNRPVPNVAEALQGQVPGLSIVSKGQPGAAPTIQLRGNTSLNEGGTPLVLVDGVPSEFNYINMDDIESITVLKDAASTSIYGSRAAHGVMLITTKRGKEGKAVFRYNGYVGMNTPANVQKSVSSALYAQIINEAEDNMGRRPIYLPDEIELYRNGSDPNRYPNTDWLGYATSNQMTTRHAIETSGGTQKVKYLVSAGMDYQTGVFASNNQKVFNIRSNTDIAVSEKFDISFDVRYQLRNLNELNNTEDGINRIFAVPPTYVAYYTDGSYGYNAGFFINPLVDIYEGGGKAYDRHDASGILKFNYQIVDGLKFTGIANANYIFGNTTQQSKQLFYRDFFTQQEYTQGQNGLTEKREHAAYYNLQALLNYSKKFGQHSVEALLGYQQENRLDRWISASRTGFPTDLVWELNGGPQLNWTNAGNGEHWAIASVIGRAHYDYAGKYSLIASFRSDASSRFAAGNRWSTFPSLATSWRLSEESFMSDARSWIDDLKVRATWGITGASSGLGLYPSYSTIQMSSIVLDNKYLQTAKLGLIGNQALGWEKTTMWNFGLDFRTLQGRLGVAAEYYIKDTRDILIGLPVPLEYGFGKPNVNIGRMKNQGWELDIRWNDRINDFNYEISGNLSNNTNEVLDLGDTKPWISGSNYTAVGLPFKSIYGYESLGLFQSDKEVEESPFQNSLNKAGDVKYKDQNGDKKIDANDRVVIGDPYPHFIYGFRLAGSYKGIDVSALFQGVGQRDYIMNDRAVRPLNDSPVFEHNLDYWTKDNADAKYPRILNKTDGDMNYQVSDYWKINSSYLRLKNLQIGYALPKSWIASSGFSMVRFYLSANNLFTISNMVPGFDPEQNNSLTYPIARTYTFGLNLQF